MLEFQINNFLKLKLKNGETSILVNDNEFTICKGVIYELDEKKLKNQKIKSVDEVLAVVKPIDINNYEILPHQIFWAHSSNLQVWAENEYDCTLLDSTLAFPLLKKLTEVGDIIAKRKFKEEIAKRFESDYIPVMIFLIRRNYLNYLSKEEIGFLLEALKERNPLMYEFLIPFFISENVVKWSKHEIEKKIVKFETQLEGDKFKPLHLHDGITFEIPFILFKIKNKKIKEEISENND
jgi:hypothetical protein